MREERNKKVSNEGSAIERGRELLGTRQKFGKFWVQGKETGGEKDRTLSKDCQHKFESGKKGRKASLSIPGQAKTT